MELHEQVQTMDGVVAVNDETMRATYGRMEAGTTDLQLKVAGDRSTLSSLVDTIESLIDPNRVGVDIIVADQLGVRAFVTVEDYFDRPHQRITR